jgi:Holliday junction DNA helicase RuvB
MRSEAMPRPPRNFNEFIGQSRVVRYVERLVRGAKEHAVACPCLLFLGPPGVGKSTLADAVGKEVGAGFRRLFAGPETRAIDVSLLLGSLMPFDVLFVDEVHRLRQNVQEVLYLALDKALTPKVADGRLDRSQFVSVAEMTVIAASSRPSGILRPLRDRLYRVEFGRYSVRELKAIAHRVAGLQEVELTPQAARRLAGLAQDSPRRVQQRVETLRLFWPEQNRFTDCHVRRILRAEGIDEYGLSFHQQLCLRTLAESPDRASSLKRLSVLLGCDVASLLEDIEPPLFAAGLIDTIPGRGRRITAAGLTAIQVPRGARKELARA